ncbi:hypothetical protein BT93_H3292 [Corymbia citriodora subsp. variegata]|nr:hypothetical protein BT93_H3292 [Corymbia citriodora subsp. variegata]
MASATSSSATAAAPSSISFKIVRRTMQSLVLLIVLISAIITVVWLALNPRPPAFPLNSLSLSGLPYASNASSPPPKLHVRIQIQLAATDPNKKLDDVNLCLAPVHGKCQLPLLSHNHTSPSEYYISKRGRRVLTFEGKAGLRPGSRTRRKRPFQFTVETVRMKVSIKFMHAYWPSKQASAEVVCENLSVGLSSSRLTGKLKDGGKDCSVLFA